MLLGKSLRIATQSPPENVVARLSAVVLSNAAIAPLKPVRVEEWLDQFHGKRFFGRVHGTKFKLGLIPARGLGVRVRGSIVVIVGTVDPGAVRARLRPPIFMASFLALFAVLVGGALVLSFFGPGNSRWVQAILVAALALPFAVVGGFFRREATLAEQTLRQVVSDHG